MNRYTWNLRNLRENNRKNLVYAIGEIRLYIHNAYDYYSYNGDVRTKNKGKNGE